MSANASSEFLTYTFLSVLSLSSCFHGAQSSRGFDTSVASDWVAERPLPFFLSELNTTSGVLQGSSVGAAAGLPLQLFEKNSYMLSQNWPGFKLDAANGVALGVSAVAAALANAAGVGGGGMFVPMFQLLGFDTKTATALSQAMITGGAIIGFFYNVRLQHPTQRKPLIDYNVALVLEPMLLLGISVGVLLNIVFPSWLITCALAALLLYMTYRTSLKGAKAWKAETRKALVSVLSTLHGKELANRQGLDRVQEKRVSDPASKEESGGVPQGPADDHLAPSSADVTITDLPAPGSVEAAEQPLINKPTPNHLQNLQSLIMKELSLVPKRRLAEVSAIWVAFLILQVLKGGRSAPSIIGVRSCTPWFWVLIIIQAPLSVGFTLFVARRLRREHTARIAEGSENEYGVGEVQWGNKELLYYPCFSFIAGMMAGLLGIGGGMVIGPMLLEMGILPQVTAATGALMVLFSSSMAVAQFLILQLLPTSYALVYGAVCAVSSLVGLVVVRRAINSYGRASLIIMVLALVIAISCAIIIVTGAVNITEQVQSGAYMGFQPLCL